jgi:hypothetical protein
LEEQREEALLQLKRERAQRLAVKRGLSDTLAPGERPRSSGQGSLRDVIPLRRGRSSTLQSQVSDIVPLQERSGTVDSISSGLVSPRFEGSRPTSPPVRGPLPYLNTAHSAKSPLQSPGLELTSPKLPMEPGREQEFTDFVQSEPHRAK